MSIYHDTAVIGANGANSYAGQAYIFKNTGGTWNEVALLKASDKAAGANFGEVASIYSDTALIGASGAKSGEYSLAGQAYSFKNTGGTWNQVAILNASDKTVGAYFGASVSQCNDTGIVGAYGAASDGYSSAGQAYIFTLVEYPVPAVTGISPKSGPLVGGTLVTVSGTGFTGVTAVKFDSTPGIITGTPTDTSITATSPAGTGTVDITVITPNGTSTIGLSDQFTFAAAPAVTSITPSTGINTSATAITVTGTGFDTTTTPMVNLTKTGYTAISLTGVSGISTSLSGTVPEGLIAGIWNVSVTNPDGQESGNLTIFSVTAPTPTPTTTGSISASDDSSSGSGAAVATAPGAAAGELMTFTFNHQNDDPDPLQIVQVQVILARPIGEMSVLVNPVTPGESNQLNGSQLVAGYRQIEPIAVNPGALSRGIITFRVTRRWLASNDVTPAQVTMLRNHDGTWSELPTTYLRNEGNYYYFAAMTPGFSCFAVAIRNISAVPSVESQTPVSVITPGSSAVATTSISPGQTLILTTACTVTPAFSETTVAPPSAPGPAGSVGVSWVPGVISAVTILLGIVGIALVCRWWIRRRNPALFRKYN